MRILHCIPSFGSGGAERQCAMLCRELSHRGHEVHLAYLLTGNADYMNQLRDSSVVLHPMGNGLGQDIWKAQKSPRVLWRLWRLISRLKPEIVQSWNRPMDTHVGVVRRLRCFPWILSERSSGLLYLDRRECLRTIVACKASAVVANSEGGLAYWKNKLRDSTSLCVIPNMVDIKELADDCSPVPWPAGFPEERTILFVGRFSPEKNVATMLHGIAKASSQRELYAILGGAGEQLNDAKALAAELGLEGRVVFPGFIARPWQWMKRAAMTLSISLCEGHPNVVTEAMVVRCPLIVSAIPAHTAFLNDSFARLVPTDDVDAIAEAIVETLDNRQAASERAHRAFDVAKQWRRDRVACQYETLYARVAAGET